MKILIFKGKSEYDALGVFVDRLKKALEKNKHNVFEIDFSKRDWESDLNKAITQNSIDLAISFNGVASILKAEDQSFFDAINIYNLAIFVDHPSYHMQRLCMPIKRHLVSFIDKSHVEFVQNIIPNSHKVKFFLPHAGINVNTIKNLSDYKKTKSIDVLFTGTAPDINRKPFIEQKANIYKDMMEDVKSLFLENMDMDVNGVIKDIKLKHHALLSPITEAQNATYLQYVILFIREARRAFLFKSLCESGINITVCGKGWEDMVKDYKNVTYLGSVGMEENLELISKTKILAHNNIDFSKGSHERVFNAMMNNTFVFSDRSEYYEEFFEENEDIVYYKFSSIKEDIKVIEQLLKDDEKLFEMTKRPKKICEEHHTWSNRAKAIEDIYEYIKFLDT